MNNDQISDKSSTGKKIKKSLLYKHKGKTWYREGHYRTENNVIEHYFLGAS